MTEGKLVASAACGAGAYWVLGEMGYTVDKTATAFGFDFNGDVAKILLSILAALAPTFITSLPAWLRPIAQAILDALLPKEEKVRRAMALVSDTLRDCPAGAKACREANDALQAHFHPSPEKPKDDNASG